MSTHGGTRSQAPYRSVVRGWRRRKIRAKNGRVFAGLESGVLIISHVVGETHKPIRVIETPLSYSAIQDVREMVLATSRAQAIAALHIRVPHAPERKRILREMGELLRQGHLPLGPLREQKDRPPITAEPESLGENVLSATS